MILARFRDHFDRACVPGRLRDPKCGLRGLILESILAHVFNVFQALFSERCSHSFGVRFRAASSSIGPPSAFRAQNAHMRKVL